ncbi:MAG: DNA polymerase III subunit delta' [Chromatiales bacterium]|jgi:DNA polymerase-3 subunit delta'
MDSAVHTRLPWQEDQWNRLQQARRQGRLPHALLFCGPRGVGKEQFALAFAQSVLCHDSDAEGRPCGACRHCHLLHSGSHPDFQWVEPDTESKSGEIKIEAIRALTGGAALTVKSGGHKVVLIQPAHRMNTPAANSLLKTLEEPTKDTLIMLLTDQPARLLPTIRSRCQKLLFEIPPQAASLAWLQGKIMHSDGATLLALASGAPLLALELDDAELLAAREEMLKQFLALGNPGQDPVALAGVWSGFDAQLLLEWLCGWVIDLLRLQTAERPPHLFNQDQVKALQGVADKLNSEALHRYLGLIYEARGLIGSNINPQLLLEKLLIEWRACHQ